MTKRLVKNIPLDNGLTLALYDASKKIAGDRWRVSCIAVVEVAVDDAAPEILSDAGLSGDQLKDILGDTVVFEKEMKRNFVDENRLNDVVSELFESMTESLVPYLSRPGFSGRMVIRKYREFQKTPSWLKANG
jgi:hypothetical protein